MTSFKLYDALELPRGCSKEEIKKAYRKLAMDHHPDKGGDESRFKELSHAYQVLSDDEKRRTYDQIGDEGMAQGGGGGGGNPHDIFEHFFGGGGHPFFGDMFGFGGPGGPGGPGGGRGGRPGPRKCRNIQHVVQMTNRDAFFGGQKTLKVTLHKKCMRCLETCNQCQGQGMVTEMQRMGPFTTMASRPCHMCNGSGSCVKGKRDCSECRGKGEYSEDKKVELTIPMGVETGATVLIAGFGEQPQQPNDVPGDLLFEFLVQMDPVFERKELDLTYRSTITFMESIVGKEIEVPMYDGPVRVDTATLGVIQPNKVYTIPGKGMKTEGGKRGALHLIFKVTYPGVLKKEAREDIGAVLGKWVGGG